MELQESCYCQFDSFAWVTEGRDTFNLDNFKFQFDDSHNKKRITVTNSITANLDKKKMASRHASVPRAARVKSDRHQRRRRAQVLDVVKFFGGEFGRALSCFIAAVCVYCENCEIYKARLVTQMGAWNVDDS